MATNRFVRSGRRATTVPPDRALALGRRLMLQQLARVRTEEGYMTEVQPGEKGSFLFVENHCPICVAATQCQGFCMAELDLFRKVLGSGVEVEREEHIIAGARRCAYRVKRSRKSAGKCGLGASGQVASSQ